MTITVNGMPRETGEGSTLGDLLRELDLEGKPVVIELNGEPVLPADHAGTSIPAGARIEIVTLAAGG